MKIIFEETALQTMHDWLVKHYPEEACGFLVGHEKDDVRVIEQSWPANNISNENRKRRFIVEPLDYLKAERKANAEGLTLLGIYHSHPDHPAIPSEHDLAAAHPYFSYTIVSVLEGVVDSTRSYQLMEGKFAEEEVQTKSHIVKAEP